MYLKMIKLPTYTWPRYFQHCYWKQIGKGPAVKVFPVEFPTLVLAIQEAHRS